MAIETTLAILFLVLLILSRGLFFLFPKQAKDFMSRFIKLRSFNFKLISVFMAVISLLILYYLLSLLTLAQIMSVVFAFVFLIGAFFMWHDEFYLSTMNVFMKKDDNWIRMHAGFAVLLALILLFYVMNGA